MCRVPTTLPVRQNHHPAVWHCNYLSPTSLPCPVCVPCDPQPLLHTMAQGRPRSNTGSFRRAKQQTHAARKACQPGAQCSGSQGLPWQRVHTNGEALGPGGLLPQPAAKTQKLAAVPARPRSVKGMHSPCPSSVSCTHTVPTEHSSRWCSSCSRCAVPLTAAKGFKAAKQCRSE